MNFLNLYNTQVPCLVALDSIIFGFDGSRLKLLLVQRGIETDTHTWSLMGGWLQPTETLSGAAQRILTELTGLNDIYLEQLGAFGDPDRDPIKRTVSIAFYALISVKNFDYSLPSEVASAWFDLSDLPPLLFDHGKMVAAAVDRLRQRASFEPIGFELLPEKFTLPQAQILYEAIFGQALDKRNFSRKLLATDWLVKLSEKQKGFSKKGAFFYKLNPEYSNTASNNGIFLSQNKKSLI